MLLQTAQDYILMACRKIGAMRPGYKPQPELLTEILTDWQVWFDALNANREMQFSNPDFKYPVTGPGSQSGGNGYTIGPTGADFTGPRPEQIIRVNVVFSSGGQSPVYLPVIPISQEQWAALAVRNIPAINVTAEYWYDPQFPNGVLNIFPPMIGNSLEIFEIGSLTAPITLTAPFSLPPAYANAIIWGLAERNYYSMINSLNIRPMPYLILRAKASNAWDVLVQLNAAYNVIGTDYPIGIGPRGDDATYYDSFVTQTGEPL